MARVDDNIFPKVIYGAQPTNPSAPVDASWKMYAKADGIYARSSNAVVGPLAASSGGGGGSAHTDSVNLTSGDISITSTTFVDVTGATVTLTTAAKRVLVTVNAVAGMSNLGIFGFLDLEIDGSRVGGTDGLTTTGPEYASGRHNMSFSFLSDALSAASHTIKLKARVSANTMTLEAASDTPLRLAVMEVL